MRKGYAGNGFLAVVVPGAVYIIAAAYLASRLTAYSPLAAVVVTLGFILCGSLAFWMLSQLGLTGSPGRMAAFFVPILLLLLARLAVFEYQTLDYQYFLKPWTEFFRVNGGLAAIGENVGNYNVPYLVFLALCSYLPMPELYLIKLLSVIFDLIVAFALARIVRRITGSAIRVGLCFTLAMALPTMFLNGALWGQCDSIYGGLGLLSLALALEKKPVRALVAAGLAFAFKLQVIFLLPVFALLLFTRRIKWYHLPVFPAVYLVAVSPAIIAGRPFWDTVLTYFSDASTIGSGLNYNSPSIFALITSTANAELAGSLGTMAAFTLCILVLAVVFFHRRTVGDRALLLCAAIFVVGIPLFLPHMHERYFFLADTITLAVAFCIPKLTPVVPLASFASLLGYYAYLRQRFLLPMRWGSYTLLLTLFLLAIFLVPELDEERGKASHDI